MEHPSAFDVPRFERRLFRSPESFTAIGSGDLGGKAAGLLLAHRALEARAEALRFPRLEIEIPRLTVLAGGVFDAFVERNGLRGLPEDDDRPIADAFLRGDLPEEHVGDLWELAREARTPLAVRSSSRLEDALEHPFAGVYATKMIPNDQPDAESRFRRLVEAVKLVYASTFFRSARRYVEAVGAAPGEEKMAVIVQEVVGRRHGERFYPDASAVARSFNFYPSGRARPDEGVVDLALGLGKTIVDGERCWSYSPAWPELRPPVDSERELLEVTQTRFWAVRMGRPPRFDPAAEDEYLTRPALAEAEADGALSLLASTWDAASDRLRPGVGAPGPRVLDFAPLLRFSELPFKDAVRGLLELFTERLGAAVEVELALDLGERGAPARLGFLQVRPMAAAGDVVEVPESSLDHPRVVVSSERALGNGRLELRDVVYVRREGFDVLRTRAIAAELAELNRRLAGAGRPYVLVGFGRWGSSEPSLGIPVEWAQVAGARVLVEAQTPELRVELSQGAHFFHNLISQGVAYLSVPAVGRTRIDWTWLESLPPEQETASLRHVRAPEPLEVLVDGRSGRGLVRRAERSAP